MEAAAGVGAFDEADRLFRQAEESGSSGSFDFTQRARGFSGGKKRRDLV